MLTFFDANDVVASNDNSPADPGSASGLNSLLIHAVPAPGTYYLRVTRFGGFGASDSYTLHISVPGAAIAAVAAAGSTLVGGTGDDTLLGDYGDDRLLGDAGADMLMDDDGADLLSPGGGCDPVGGGAGTDVLLLLDWSISSYAALRSGETIFLVAAGETYRIQAVGQVWTGDGAAQGWDTALTQVTAFDGLRYIAGHADLRAAFGADLAAGTAHFATAGFDDASDSRAFDPFRYLASYTDCAALLATTPPHPGISSKRARRKAEA